MKNNKKTIQITDTAHGIIQLSHLEKEVISTKAFNRLHNILQNSTAYLTYPANNTKRFEHSIGTMYLSGKIFYYSLLNAEEDLRCEFLNEVDEYIDELFEDDDLIDKLGLNLDDPYLRMIGSGEYKEIFTQDPLYKKYLPNCVKEKYEYAYLVLFQSIRLIGLMHDLGHPPFSHLTEFALEEVFNKINKKEVDDYNNREEKFINATSDYFDDKENHDLHESIGNNISKKILYSLISQNVDIKNKNDAKYQFFLWVIYYFAMDILNDVENPAFLKDVHKLVDGSIDGDRLDYVSRDMINSGFDVGKIEYDRLISSMKLMKNKEKDKVDYLFCPRLKTINTIEDYFHRRWKLYKYILYHHRVSKTDALLKESIIQVSLDYLSEDNDEEIFDAESMVLPSGICGLWDAVKKVHSLKEYFNALIQWDDAWLMTVLKRSYFENYHNEDSNIRYKLEELLSNKKYYNSLIKRMEEFKDIDKEVAFSLEENNILEKLETLKGAFGEDTRENIITNIKKILKSYEDGHIPDEGFILYQLSNLFDTLLEDNIFDIIVNEVVEEIVKSSGEIKDAIVVAKPLKTGLKNMPYIYRDNEIHLLDEFSNIEKDLKRDRNLFPLFYIYLFNPKRIDYSKLRNKIGKKLADKIVYYINEIS